MGRLFDEGWSWVKTAPLPVVLALILGLSAWVYAIDVEQKVEVAKSVGVVAQVNRMDGKLDMLLEAVADLRAEQKAERYRLRFAPTAPPKEK